MKPALICILLVSLGTQLLGQRATPTPAATPAASPDATPVPALPVWKCKLPGGTYEVALRSIVAVSTQDYIVDNVARVNELNIDTTGNMVVRFYYLEPLTPSSPVGLGQATIDKVKDVLNEAAERTGQDAVWKKVVKNYPTTTHAHTTEYRVDSKEDIDKLFKSAEAAFRSGKNTEYKP
ncbi:MAG: hypothetical protein M3O82_05550 [Verrucomicrobiota bacterium]|nr:hypothetical protein [Verrucomicrobiota bacterium]